MLRLTYACLMLSIGLGIWGCDNESSSSLTHTETHVVNTSSQGETYEIVSKIPTWLKTGPFEPPYFRIPRSEGCVMQIGANVRLQLTAPPEEHGDGKHLFVTLKTPQADRVRGCEVSAAYIERSDWYLKGEEPTPTPTPTPIPDEKNPMNLHPSAQKVLVLMYHEIVDSHPKYDSDVTYRNFSEQMQLLLNHGYNTISMDEFYQNQAFGRSLPAKPVLLTFDDGYIGNYTRAYPLLKQLGMKATFFVHTRYVGIPGAYDHMTWNQLREIDQHHLFEVHSHTLNHLNLSDLNQARRRIEIAESRQELEQQLGPRSVAALAYPFGGYSQAVIEETNRSYKIAFVVERQGSSRNLYNIPRMGIGKSLNTLSAFQNFLRIWSGRYL